MMYGVFYKDFLVIYIKSYSLCLLGFPINSIWVCYSGLYADIDKELIKKLPGILSEILVLPQSAPCALCSVRKDVYTFRKWKIVNLTITIKYLNNSLSESDLHIRYIT